MRFLVSVAVLSAGFFLSGCATSLRVPLTEEQKVGITEVKSKVIIIQDEVIVAVQPSMAGMLTGGGLVGAVIDSKVTNSRVKSAQAIMGPFYNAIENLDYRVVFQTSAKSGFAGYPFRVTEVTATPRSLRQEDLDQWRNELGPKQALMIVAPRYQLSGDFRTLDSETFVTLWTAAGGNAPVQRSVIYYQSLPLGNGQADSVTKWSASNAAAFHAALNESIAETLRLVQVDVKAGDQPIAKGAELQEFDFHSGNKAGKISGHALARSDRRVTVLGADGKLYSLPASGSTGDTTVAKQ